jgi:hypothetical protein
MSIVEFLPAVCSEVDEQRGALPTHPEAHLGPSSEARADMGYRYHNWRGKERQKWASPTRQGG